MLMGLDWWNLVDGKRYVCVFRTLELGELCSQTITALDHCSMPPPSTQGTHEYLFPFETHILLLSSENSLASSHPPSPSPSPSLLHFHVSP